MVGDDKKKWRYFQFLVYPKSAPDGWLDILRDSLGDYAVSPLHSGDSEENEPHYHVIYKHGNSITLDCARQFIPEQVPANGYIEPVIHPTNAQRYLIHLDQKDKEQFQDGENAYLGVADFVGGVLIFDLEGNLVEDSALLSAVAELAAPVNDDLHEAQQKALARLLPEGAELQPMQLTGLANSVTGAYSVDTGDGVLYAFVARPYGYANEVMELYYVLDENGAIVAMRAKELILHSEYFTSYTLDESSYRDNFLGLTADEYAGEEALITGATMSSDAVDTATRDVFEAFRLATAN